MRKAARELLHKALELSEAERVRLARTLLESVEDGSDEAGLSPDWRAELERRLADEPTAEKPWETGEQLLARLERAQKRSDAARARASKRRRGA